MGGIKEFFFGKTKQVSTLDPRQREMQDYLYRLLTGEDTPVLRSVYDDIADLFGELRGQTAQQFAGAQRQLEGTAGALGLQTKAPGRFLAQLGDLGAQRISAMSQLGLQELLARRAAKQQAIENALAFMSPQTLAYIKKSGLLDYAGGILQGIGALKGGGG